MKTKTYIFAFVIAFQGCSGNGDEGVAREPANAGASAQADARPPASLTASDVACAGNADCTLVYTGCCENLPKTAADLVAIRPERAVEYRMSITRSCVYCPAIAAGRQDPAIVAACVRGSCEVLELRENASVTECATDADCKIRSASCCPCGEIGAADMIAVSDETAYEKVACGRTCPQCDVSMAAGARAYCSQGSCAVAAAP